nr:hypothetical protein [uncultured Fluviicola sp.]
MKTFLNLIFFVLIQFTSQGQNLYVTVSSGYNFSFGTSNFDNYYHNKLVGAFYTQNKDRFEYSLGKGMNVNLGIGYKIKRNIGFELEGSYLMGIKTIGKTDYFVSDVFKKEIWGRFYRISPTVYVLQSLKRLSLKVSIGALAGFGKMYLNQSVTYNGGIPSFEYENEFSGGGYLGFKAGIGIVYPINSRLNLSADLNWVNAYFSPMRGRVNKFVSGGHDYTDILDVWDREVKYSNSIDKTFYTSDEPAHMLRENFAASSIGLQVGIQWILWKKEKIEKKEEGTD